MEGDCNVYAHSSLWMRPTGEWSINAKMVYRLANLTISRPISLFGTENTKINRPISWILGSSSWSWKTGSWSFKKIHDQEPLFYNLWLLDHPVLIKSLQSSEHRFPPCLHPELSTMWYNHSIITSLWTKRCAATLCSYGHTVWGF